MEVPELIEPKWFNVFVVGVHLKKSPVKTIATLKVLEETKVFDSERDAWKCANRMSKEIVTRDKCEQNPLINVCQTIAPKQDNFTEVYAEVAEVIVCGWLDKNFESWRVTPFWERTVMIESDNEVKVNRAVAMMSSLIKQHCPSYIPLQKKFVDNSEVFKKAVEVGLTGFFAEKYLEISEKTVA